MPALLAILLVTVSILFVRASLVTLGFYKEPILTAFQQYGEEVGFSPLFEACWWGYALAYLIFMLIAPSSSLVLFGITSFVASFILYWKIKDSVMRHPQIFLKFPRWYHEIVDRTSREERRKLSYMWLALPLRTRLLYNAQHDEFRKWVELVVLSVA